MALREGRWQLPVLLAMFFIPTFAAMLLVFTGWRPAGFTNNGDLVQPAAQLNPGEWQALIGQAPMLTGDWLIVVPQTSACEQPCVERLDQLNRVRVALDRDIERVRLVVLQPSNRTTPVIDARAGADLLVLSAPLAQVNALAQHNGQAMAAHIIDYRGYHAMRYAAPLDASGLLDDLEKMLRLGKEEAERRALEEATAE